MRRKHINTWLLGSATLVVSFVGTLFLYPAFSQTFFEPAGGFPGSNTPTPINVGPLAQVKDGALTLLSTLNLSDNRGVNVKDPINPQDVATKAYVDSHSSVGAFIASAYPEVQTCPFAGEAGTIWAHTGAEPWPAVNDQSDPNNKVCQWGHICEKSTTVNAQFTGVFTYTVRTGANDECQTQARYYSGQTSNDVSPCTICIIRP